MVIRQYNDALHQPKQKAILDVQHKHSFTKHYLTRLSEHLKPTYFFSILQKTTTTAITFYKYK